MYKNSTYCLYLYKKKGLNNLSTNNLPVFLNLVTGQIRYYIYNYTNCLRFLNAYTNRLEILKASRGKSGIYMWTI